MGCKNREFWRVSMIKWYKEKNKLIQKYKQSDWEKILNRLKLTNKENRRTERQKECQIVNV